MRPNPRIHTEVEARLRSPGGWGEMGDAYLTRYLVAKPRMRRKCRQGEDCPNRATHLGMANGVALMAGCEFHVRLWVRNA